MESVSLRLSKLYFMPSTNCEIQLIGNQTGLDKLDKPMSAGNVTKAK